MRIFAPFYFYLLIVGILSLVGIITLATSDFIKPFTYTNNYLLANSWYVGHSWSLAVEDQFYLLFPPLLVILRKKKIILTLLMLLLLAPVLRVVGYHLYPQYEDIATVYGFHANMDALAAGCLLSFAAEYEYTRNFLLKIAKLPQAIVILLILIIYFANTQGAHPHLFLGVYSPFMNVGIALIIYWAITNSESSFIGKILNTKILSFVGVLSYSLYLWQQLFTGKEMLGFFPFNLVAAFACALFSYYTVERYSLKLRNYLENPVKSPQNKPALKTV
jgi:peptidoglycan/LPS O-acetylase OafA/YrhL